jgi:hypothetical protein
MKINCATSSRKVMPFIQRRTVEDALRGSTGFLLAGVAFGGGGGASPTAPEAAANTRKTGTTTKRESTTFPV